MFGFQALELQRNLENVFRSKMEISEVKSPENSVQPLMLIVIAHK